FEVKLKWMEVEQPLCWALSMKGFEVKLKWMEVEQPLCWALSMKGVKFIFHFLDLTPSMNQAAIRKLVVDSVAAALEAQAVTMANTENNNRNTRQRETAVARKCNYKEFMSCQPFNSKGTEGVVGLICWFE
nr:reverse transcriptase domain-containing protein [Tanacetum cinerariifolium]